MIVRAIKKAFVPFLQIVFPCISVIFCVSVYVVSSTCTPFCVAENFSICFMRVSFCLLTISSLLSTPCIVESGMGPCEVVITTFFLGTSVFYDDKIKN